MKEANPMVTLSPLTPLVSQIKTLMTQARAAVAHEVNAYNLKTYWEIGRIIVEYEQKGNVKAQYGTQLLKDLSKRQIETSLFERLLLSDGSTNKETVLVLSREGITMSKPEDILRKPYVFEFLGTREQKPVLEKDLERRLIRHIEDFLLELGRGFMFVGSQQRVTLGNKKKTTKNTRKTGKKTRTMNRFWQNFSLS